MGWVEFPQVYQALRRNGRHKHQCVDKSLKMPVRSLPYRPEVLPDVSLLDDDDPY